MKKRIQISLDEAKRIEDSLYIDWDQINLEQFRQGLMGNHKQEAMDPETELIYEGVLHTAQVVLAHLQDFPDYFTHLENLKTEVHEYQARRRQRTQVPG